MELDKLDSPPPKRPRLASDSDDDDVYKPEPPPDQGLEAEELEEEHCSICLQPLSDRTIIPACSHEFCFECLLIWTEQSRRCPLCSGQVGDYLIHNIRSKYDFSKHYLNPLRASPRSEPPLTRVPGPQRHTRRREIRWGRDGRRAREREADELERAIEKRKWVYQHRLYAKHVASNSYTRYRPFPTPAQFAANPDLISRATIFVRRELRVWDALDVEFLTTFTISLMKSIDIRSESAVKLLAEFLDMDTDERLNAEHFAHELYCYLRSPYRNLTRYDAAVQYDTSEYIPPLHHRTRTRRWEDEPVPQSTSPSPGPYRSYARSRSPTDTQNPPPRERSIRRRRSRSSLEVPHLERQRAEHENHADLRNSSGMSDHVDIVVDVKGKGRAVDSSNVDHINSITDRASDVNAANVKGTYSEGSGRQRSNSIDATSPASRGTSPVSPPHVRNKASSSASRAVYSDRPRLRRDALQAVGSHLAHSYPARSAPRSTDGRCQDSFVDHSPHKTAARVEISIRGAAKVAGLALSASTTSSPELSQEPNGQIPSHAAVNPTKGMSSREIMARTRARLAKLRQEPTLFETISSERGEHDALSPNSSSDIIGSAVGGSQTVNLGSSPSNVIIADVPGYTAAQSSLSHSLSLSDERDGAAALHAKLLGRLDVEKRAWTELNAGRQTAVGLDCEDVENRSAPAGTAIEPLSNGESTLRGDAQKLESKLRAQAQLRVRLAAAKRNLPSTNASLVSRETYLRSQLKRDK